MKTTLGVSAVFCILIALVLDWNGFLWNRPPALQAAQRMAFWEERLGRDFARRGGAIPPEVLALIGEENMQRGGKPPVAGKPDPAFLRDYHAALAGIPPSVRTRIEPRITGIFFAENLGSSGYTGYVYDDSGSIQAGFIVIDVAELDRPANDWLAWKEGKPFHVAQHDRLEATLEPTGSNNRQQAIQFLLLHEYGHIFAIRQLRDGANQTYLEHLSHWTYREGITETPYREVFPQRDAIRYYQAEVARFEGRSFPSVYQGLRKTVYPTLYGATSADEEFAETFALYVHSVMLGKPYAIRWYQDDRYVDEYNLFAEMARMEPAFGRMAADLHQDPAKHAMAPGLR